MLPVLIESCDFNKLSVDIITSIRESLMSCGLLTQLQISHQLHSDISCHILLITSEIITLYASYRDATEQYQTVIPTIYGLGGAITVRVLRKECPLLVIVCHHLSLVCGITPVPTTSFNIMVITNATFRLHHEPSSQTCVHKGVIPVGEQRGTPTPGIQGHGYPLPNP